MEDNVQRIFSILLAVLMFFLLPLYIAFEKKDDIAYNLALKITTNFVDNVNEKGYLTYDMYNDFITELTVTGNVYKVNLEYIAKEYNPVIQVLKREVSSGKEEIVKEYDYLSAKHVYDKFVNEGNRSIITYDTWGGIDENASVTGDAQLTYKLSEYRYSTDQILRFIDNETSDSDFIAKSEYNGKDYGDISAFPRIYGLKDEGLLVMNEGDQFNVVIQNENTTIATVLFNTLTFGANSGNDTKVYINYGGTIKNQEYMPKLIGDVDDNGVVNAADKTLLQNYISSSSKKGFFSIKQKIAADTNKDGEITTADLSYY